MKPKFFIFFLISIACLACNGNKKLDLNSFEIDIPKDWNYKELNSTESFTGAIVGPNSTLTFDYSTNGYANGLVLTEQQYLADQSKWAPSKCYFCKPDVIYAAKQDIKRVKSQLMQERMIKDSSLVKVEANIEFKKEIYKPDNTQKKKYPNADYIAKLTYKDSTIIVPIIIPGTIKIHNIRIDTTDKYIIKTVWPKIPGIGITGIYYKSRTTNLNFNMQGSDLPLHEQQLALTAFKTIKIKE